MVYTADEEFDEEEFDEDWIEDDNPDDVLLVCPACHQEVHEDTQQCPHCGDWIIPAYPNRPIKRWLVAAITLLLVGMLVLMAVL